MQRVVLTFGLIAGAILSIMMLVTVPFMDRIGFDKGAIIGYTTMVLAFLMTFFGIRSYRENVAGGTISFGRAFGLGLMITVVATVCYVITWEVIYYKIMPDFGDKYTAYAVEQTRKSGATQAQIDAKQKEMMAFKESYRNPVINASYTFLEPLPVGLLLTLISAALLRRKTAEL
ncbi:MAG TPA: DUF4199 domain-containing protein [Gemmatimonadaceae bacterium]|jgi:hypothetical protein|nr:DUF4199 domain-containing protein [Gemmatimonadaceae bacterium]